MFRRWAIAHTAPEAPESRGMNVYGNCFGHTLIELVLVIIFLSVAILASMNMLTSSLSGSAETELVITATNLANEKMERILADKRSKGYSYVDSDNYPDEINVNNLVGFSRFVTVTSYSTYKQVQVTVTNPDIENCLLAARVTNY